MLQITAVGTISVGVVLVLLLGEIDLSVGAVSGLCAAIMAVLSVKHGWTRYLAIAAGVAGRARSALFQGFVFDSLRDPVRSSSRWPGLLAWQGLSSRCSATTGTVNITDPTITGLAGTFYGDAVGWILAAVGIARVRRRAPLAAAAPHARRAARRRRWSR